MVLAILSGDFNFVDAHGPFWFIFGVEILIFIFFFHLSSLFSFLMYLIVLPLSRNVDFLSRHLKL